MRGKTLRGRIWKALQRQVRKQRRMEWRLFLAALALFGVTHLVLRPEPPPREPEDLCAIFEEKPYWYRASRDAARQWEVPEAVQLAILYQESSFLARARPPRSRILWIFPGPRPSSAYGYAQVLDATWNEFRAAVDRPRARRDDFDDVAHFVGWYGQELHRLTGIARTDAYRLYLAYHEGPGGFLEGRHQRKSWLLTSARRVEERARRYQRQIDACRDDLRGPFPWLWFLLLLALGAVLGWAYHRRQPRRWRRNRRRGR